MISEMSHDIDQHVGIFEQGGTCSMAHRRHHWFAGVMLKSGGAHTWVIRVGGCPEKVQLFPPVLKPGKRRMSGWEPRRMGGSDLSCCLKRQVIPFLPLRAVWPEMKKRKPVLPGEAIT